MKEISILKSRILHYLDHKGFTKYKFYQDSGVTNGILSQNNGISEENLLKFISAYQDISPEWLLLGRGEMLRDEAQAVGGVSIHGNNMITESPISNGTPSETVAALVEQIRFKDEQIKIKDEQIRFKDEQINSLLELLKKGL